MSLVQLRKPMLDAGVLAQRKSLPLDAKIAMSKKRIKEWSEHWDGDVYVAFSGGKDSTVLLRLVREALGADVPALFCDTGLEYPELKAFVKTFSGVTVVRPEMSYREVVTKYGFPVVSKKVARMLRFLKNPTAKNAAVRRLYLDGMKRDGTKTKFFKLPAKHRYLIDAPFKVSEQCCDVMKKEPAARYEKATKQKPFIGSLADESDNRRLDYERYGCNAFDLKRPKSTPLAFWTEQDVLEYIVRFNVDIASVYGRVERDPDGLLHTTGEDRTGCVWCMFGAEHRGADRLTRFQRLAITHPKIWRYCIEDMGMAEVLDFLGIEYRPPMDEELARMLA